MVAVVVVRGDAVFVIRWRVAMQGNRDTDHVHTHASLFELCVARRLHFRRSLFCFCFVSWVPVVLTAERACSQLPDDDV